MKSFCVLCVSSEHQTNDCPKLKAQKVASPVVLQTLKEEIGSVTTPKVALQVASQVASQVALQAEIPSLTVASQLTKQERWRAKHPERYKEIRRVYMKKQRLGEKILA